MPRTVGSGGDVVVRDEARVVGEFEDVERWRRRRAAERDAREASRRAGDQFLTGRLGMVPTDGPGVDRVGLVGQQVGREVEGAILVGHRRPGDDVEWLGRRPVGDNRDLDDHRPDRFAAAGDDPVDGWHVGRGSAAAVREAEALDRRQRCRRGADGERDRVAPAGAVEFNASELVPDRDPGGYGRAVRGDVGVVLEFAVLVRDGDAVDVTDAVVVEGDRDALDDRIGCRGKQAARDLGLSDDGEAIQPRRPRRR